MYRPSITIDTAGIMIPTKGTRILGSKFVASSLVITFFLTNNVYSTKFFSF